MADEAIERVESKLAFLERASAELGEEVFRQRREIEELRARLAALAGRLDAAASSPSESDPLGERPPHY